MFSAPGFGAYFSTSQHTEQKPFGDIQRAAARQIGISATLTRSKQKKTILKIIIKLTNNIAISCFRS